MTEEKCLKCGSTDLNITIHRDTEDIWMWNDWYKRNGPTFTIEIDKHITTTCFKCKTKWIEFPAVGIKEEVPLSEFEAEYYGIRKISGSD